MLSNPSLITGNCESYYDIIAWLNRQTKSIIHFIVCILKQKIITFRFVYYDRDWQTYRCNDTLWYSDPVMAAGVINIPTVLDCNDTACQCCILMSIPEYILILTIKMSSTLCIVTSVLKLKRIFDCIVNMTDINRQLELITRSLLHF